MPRTNYAGLLLLLAWLSQISLSAQTPAPYPRVNLATSYAVDTN